ncbi:hypothetical protein [Nonomuraea sp. NPDC049158]|uniref:hypothetical protein n=1 Tax=Nonomuraea sp. NPDC049158 TaxID=3155649 RepID=UPI0033E6D6F0
MRREWELEDLLDCWTLDEQERAVLANKSGATRLGFGLMLKYFELEELIVADSSGADEEDEADESESGSSAERPAEEDASHGAGDEDAKGDDTAEAGDKAGGMGGGRAFLQELKSDPGPMQLDTLLAEIVKLERVKAIGLPEGLFEGVSEKIVAGWRAEGP